MSQIQIEVEKHTLAKFCRRNHIRSLAFFGSVLGDTFSEDSDVDVLVEFEPGHVPGLALIRMQDELSQILGGRNVDLVTSKFLNRHIRKQVLSEAVVQYARE